MITGYYEEIVGNKIYKKPQYSSASIIYTGEKLPLNNREKLKYLKAMATNKQEIDLSVPCE